MLAHRLKSPVLRQAAQLFRIKPPNRMPPLVHRAWLVFVDHDKFNVSTGRETLNQLNEPFTNEIIADIRIQGGE